ncbi:conserved hypothetical protein [Culex quinquefasciatus]|uniref:Ig-like domain-containing protein n=1 Tax=Culex quinquefasciatus TaxID=7176 RepID=B0X6I8_CULQU|nr:conserved hypothetical protein [Culex quinquefasciatus]|eukprot:XP_001865260.1 conserved hypothetical protein [Culex quinquefasciatus]
MDEGRYMIEAENIAGKETIRHEIKKLNKEEYCHVYGIKYHDPTIMKHGAYEEPVAGNTVIREAREFVFMDDGSYYIRGQTPEHLWEYETDTSADSEYEPYVGSTEDEIDTNEQNDDDEDEDKDEDEEEKNTTDNEENNDTKDDREHSNINKPCASKGKQEKSCYGIFHADPRRQYKDEEVKEQRQYREVVFLEDGSYYVRGQTPEQFWEWETDTSAESEYEMIKSESEESPDETEDQDESEKEDKNTSSMAADEEIAADATQSDEISEIDKEDVIEKTPKPIRRGPKIKKMRKKIYKPSEKPTETPQQPDLKKTCIAAERQTKQTISHKILSDQPKDAPLKSKKKPVEVEFISHLRNQTLLKGKTLSLNCCCSDNTKLEVNWYKDGEKFEMNRRCVSDVHFGFITLEIYRTVVEDSGTYECHVKTANGEAKESCKITVFELPDKQTVDLVPPTFLQLIKGKN